MAVSRKRPPESWAAIRAALKTGLAELCARSECCLDIAVGYSGGLDSTVLLDALMRLPSHGKWRLRAVHVNHGLSPHARAWQEHCASTCAERGVAFFAADATVSRAPRTSLEEEARRERYRILRACRADVVALAHHADDQAETIVLQLLRGAGPHGMSAMPRLRDEGTKPWTWRPLLELPRTTLAAYAHSAGLTYVEDESNDDLDLRRNFVRHRVLPLLAQAFPAPVKTLARAATLQAEAAALISILARQDLQAVGREGALDCEALAGFSRARQSNLLREWIAQAGLRAPSAARLNALLDSLGGRAGRLRWEHAGWLVFARHGRLFLVPADGARALKAAITPRASDII
ncbi:MAG: tRNA lysidine(34) synthetase TilS [Burkholderiales bacterium]|nr:tRNA lysidine(34) synthetase TilS [Burkholderiales bacterium]